VEDLLAVLPERNVLNEREDKMTAYNLAVCKPSQLSTNLSPNSFVRRQCQRYRSR